MSDISLKWGLLDYIEIVLVLCGPGALVGLAIGAIGWRERRVLGALLGAIEGFLLLFCYLYVYIESSLSVSEGAARAAFRSLAITWPGILVGGALGSWLWKTHRILGAVALAPIGFVLSLYAWWLLA